MITPHHAPARRRILRITEIAIDRKAYKHNEPTCKFVDGQRLQHTRALCSHHAVRTEPGCYTTAGPLHAAVRRLGGSAL